MIYDNEIDVFIIDNKSRFFSLWPVQSLWYGTDSFLLMSQFLLVFIDFFS